MKILAVGGGSGGHVTPVVAVLRAVRDRDPEVEIRFWCDRKFAPHAKSIIGVFDKNIDVEKIYSGKLRRYNNVPVLKQLIRPDILFPNLRDMALVAIGFVQSMGKLIMWRPDVIFTKGGFVCLPVGIAAKVLRIPLVIHDSDAHPGLTNRVLALWATRIATGAPLKYYPYPKERTKYVGIPVAQECIPYTPAMKKTAKKSLGFNEDRQLIVVTGGGLGAQRINEAVEKTIDSYLDKYSVMLISGSGQYEELSKRLGNKYDSQYFQLHAFVSPLVPALGAADIVIARAGATTLLELSAMMKPTVLIPNGYLTGGHQLKNAMVYEEKDAVVILDEHKLDEDPNVLFDAVSKTLSSPDRLRILSHNIYMFAKPNAAKDTASLIFDAAASR